MMQKMLMEKLALDGLFLLLVHPVMEITGTRYFSFSLMADICHAYQLLKKDGLKEENIVVFMYDDIANNELNPRPGIIINHPQGSDVYAGVPKVTQI
uniref:Uncharacterized protein n=1 Tax=Quercus lobata TaxID=97700 RepID=A0A7N2MRQ6_QUELO